MKSNPCRERVAVGIVGPHAQMPLADGPGGVAAFLEQFGQRHFAVRQMPRRAIAQHAKLFVAHAAADRIPSGQQRRAAGRADFGRRVEIGEPHPLGRHAIQVRRADAGMPVAAQIAVAQVVGQDENDVRMFGIGRSGLPAEDADYRRDGQNRSHGWFLPFFEIRVSCKVSILRRIGNTLACVQVIDADGPFYGSKR